MWVFGCVGVWVCTCIYTHQAFYRSYVCVCVCVCVCSCVCVYTYIYRSTHYAFYHWRDMTAEGRRRMNLTWKLKWEEAGSEPPKGTELKNELLATALRDKTDFTHEDLDRFGVSGVFGGRGG